MADIFLRFKLRVVVSDNEIRSCIQLLVITNQSKTRSHHFSQLFLMHQFVESHLVVMQTYFKPIAKLSPSLLTLACYKCYTSYSCLQHKPALNVNRIFFVLFQN